MRQARAHEAAHEDDLAARRYTEALALDGLSSEAWIGLGELRLRIGEPAEAERVFQAALARVPALPRALEGRARARFRLGRHAEAEEDLAAYAEAEHDVPTFRELATWFAADRMLPPQLATWRRLLALSRERNDAAAALDANRMVRALILLVDGADPVTSPSDASRTREALARIGRRAL